MSNQTDIVNWRQFEQVRVQLGCQLLQRLSHFPDAVLVGGCQRSGTTMLARIITQSAGMVNYWFGPDDELDAALLLSGLAPHEPVGRYCFQTTYLDNCYHEYLEQSDEFRLIWVLRNPFSVVYSMLNNWPDYALTVTFRRCGVPMLRGVQKWSYRLFGERVVSRVQRACLVYNGKVAQLGPLCSGLGQRMMVVDYDDLVAHKERVLSEIYRFIDLPYRDTYAETIRSNSLKKLNRLTENERATVEKLSVSAYRQAQAYLPKLAIPSAV